MPEFLEIINSINRVTTILFLCLVPLLIASYRQITRIGKNKSNFLSILIFFVANTTMYGYQLLLQYGFGANTQYKSLYLFCWFMGFAWFNLFALYTIYCFHKKENIRIEKLGMLISVSFCIYSAIQLIQYSEIVLFSKMEFFLPIYQFMIPVLNLITFTGCFIIITISALILYAEKKNYKGLQRLQKWFS